MRLVTYDYIFYGFEKKNTHNTLQSTKTELQRKICYSRLNLDGLAIGEKIAKQQAHKVASMESVTYAAVVLNSLRRWTVAGSSAIFFAFKNT